MVLRSSGWSCTTRQPWSPAALCTAARSTRLSTRDSITQGPFVITDQTWMKQPWPALNDSHCPISRCIGARGSCVRSPGDWHKVGPLTTSDLVTCLATLCARRRLLIDPERRTPMAFSSPPSIKLHFNSLVIGKPVVSLTWARTYFLVSNTKHHSTKSHPCMHGSYNDHN